MTDNPTPLNQQHQVNVLKQKIKEAKDKVRKLEEENTRLKNSLKV